MAGGRHRREQSHITIMALEGNLDATTADKVSQRISAEMGRTLNLTRQGLA
jgi:hypothetical protein